MYLLGSELRTIRVPPPRKSTVRDLLDRFMESSHPMDLGEDLANGPLIGWTRWAIDPLHRLVAERSYRLVWDSNSTVRTSGEDKEPFAWGSFDSGRTLGPCIQCVSFHCSPYYTPPPAMMGLVAGWGRVKIRVSGWESSRAWPLAVWPFCCACAHNMGRFRTVETVTFRSGGTNGRSFYGVSVCDRHSDRRGDGLCPEVPVEEILRRIRMRYGLPETRPILSPTGRHRPDLLLDFLE